MKHSLNQKLLNLIEYYNLINNDLFISNYPIKRNIPDKYNFSQGSKKEKLNNLKKMITNIKNCELKKNANKLVFADGNPQSSIMLIGEGPGAQEAGATRPQRGPPPRSPPGPAPGAPHRPPRSPRGTPLPPQWPPHGSTTPSETC